MISFDDKVRNLENLLKYSKNHFIRHLFLDDDLFGCLKGTVSFCDYSIEVVSSHKDLPQLIEPYPCRDLTQKKIFLFEPDYNFIKKNQNLKDNINNQIKRLGTYYKSISFEDAALKILGTNFIRQTTRFDSPTLTKTYLSFFALRKNISFYNYEESDKLSGRSYDFQRSLSDLELNQNK